jgi:hypothetical protein
MGVTDCWRSETSIDAGASARSQNPAGQLPEYAKLVSSRPVGKEFSWQASQLPMETSGESRPAECWWRRRVPQPRSAPA